MQLVNGFHQSPRHLYINRNMHHYILHISGISLLLPPHKNITYILIFLWGDNNRLIPEKPLTQKAIMRSRLEAWTETFGPFTVALIDPRPQSLFIYELVTLSVYSDKVNRTGFENNLNIVVLRDRWGISVPCEIFPSATQLRLVPLKSTPDTADVFWLSCHQNAGWKQEKGLQREWR